MHGTRRFVECSTMLTMTLTKVEKNIAITIHDTLITDTVALHLASGIHTEAFCSTVIFLLQTILDRVQKITHPRLFKQEREGEYCFYSTADMRPLFDLSALGYFGLDLIHASRLRQRAQIA